MATTKGQKGNTPPAKTKKIAKVAWVKFYVKNGKIAFTVNNNYVDKAAYENDLALPVNGLVQDSLLPTTELIKLLESGKIKNLKITYNIHE